MNGGTARTGAGVILSTARALRSALNQVDSKEQYRLVKLNTSQ